jgi:hypothetical protein
VIITNNNPIGLQGLLRDSFTFFILLSRLSSYMDENIGDLHCGFQLTDQLLIRLSAWRKNRNTMRQNISYSYEGSIVQYSPRVWGTNEISLVD